MNATIDPVETPELKQTDPGRQPLKRPRLGFLGTGWIGRHRLQAVAADGTAEICGVADSLPAARDEAGKIAPDAALVENLYGLLELEPDGIVIATPSALHANQAITALEKGCAVYCQKPLSRTAKEARRVIDAAKASNRLLGVDFCYRHTAGMTAIKGLIQRGQLGDLYGIELTFHNAYGPDKPWFFDMELSGGGCLMDLGIHLVDLALWCLDFPPVTKAVGLLIAGAKTAALKVEDYALAQFQAGDSTAVQLACSWKAPAGCDAWIEAVFYGTKGGARFRNVKGSFYDFISEQLLPERSVHILTQGPDDWGGRGIVEWSRQLAGSNAFDPKSEQAYHVARVLDLIYKRDHEAS